MRITVEKDMDRAIGVMREASRWLSETGKPVSKWWKLENLNLSFLCQYARPEEFYVLSVDSQPAAAAILQISQNAQDWQVVDREGNHKALYVHWLCVGYDFHGQGLSQKMIDFAKELAREQNITMLRADTNASEDKLRDVYESLGFQLVTILKEDYRQTALYELRV
jgi:ribosomal protein S18 acetylase RimI-like enzyme